VLIAFDVTAKKHKDSRIRIGYIQSESVTNIFFVAALYLDKPLRLVLSLLRLTFAPLVLFPS